MHKFTRRTLAVSTAAVLLLGGGAAYAYWTNSGSGSGTAATGTNAPVTVKQTSVIAAMYPGQPAQTLSGNFDNPNAGTTFVTAVTATGFAIDEPHATAGCLPASYTLGGTAPVNTQVPFGTAQGAWTGLTITMNNLVTNQDACKNAVVTITYASN
jgi:hypothetical protein